MPLTNDINNNEEGVYVVAPSMYWSVIPGEAYAMRYSTARGSLMEARLRRMKQLRDKRAKEKKHEHEQP
jgi:hypothetical protein